MPEAGLSNETTPEFGATGVMLEDIVSNFYCCLEEFTPTLEDSIGYAA